MKWKDETRPEDRIDHERDSFESRQNRIHQQIEARTAKTLSLIICGEQKTL